MKVLGILGSSRKDGNTNDLLDIALNGAAEGGCEVEKISLVDYNIHHIYNCKECKGRGKCSSDDFHYVRDKLFASDGVIWATPLYWYSMSGLLKVFLDRLCCVMYLETPEYLLGKLKGKQSALIWTQEEPFERGQHLLGTMQFVCNYKFCQMVDLGYVWAIGGSRGTSIKDTEVVKQAYALGKKFANYKNVS